MTKAYLAGFIAGMVGKDWEDNPFDSENKFGYCATQWRKGCDDGYQVSYGNEDIGRTEVDK